MIFLDEPAGDEAGEPAAGRSRVPRAPRSTTMLLAARVTGKVHDTLCLISNISTGGLRARGPLHAFPVGEDVRIEVRHAYLLAGRVVWVDGAAFGVRFDGPLGVPAFLADLASPEPSLDGRPVRAPRLPTRCQVEVRAWGRIHRPIMTDISQRGARLALGAEVLPPETPLNLVIPGLMSLRAVVRWVREEECGIAFLETVPLTQMAEWLMDPALRHGARY